MVNITEIITQINSTGISIPLSITQTTQQNWTQFGVLLGVSLLGSVFLLFMFWDLMKIFLGDLIAKVYLWKISRITGRSVILIKHHEMSLFNISMITRTTMMKFQKAIQKIPRKTF